MAHNCYYRLQVTAKNKEAIDRFFNVMDNKDNEFYLYRVFSVANIPGTEKEIDGRFVADFDGDVAWSTHSWVDDEPNPNDTIKETGAHYSNLQEVCKALGVGVEVWSEECGFDLMEHYAVNNLGEIIRYEVSDDWQASYEDDDGVWHEEEGGFPEWGTYLPPSEIMKERN